MHRRTLLKAGGFGLLSASLGGCARGMMRSSSIVGSAVDLRPVRVSWDRVIRTTVGLRPFRRTGFLVAAERLDHKVVVHNYGHGGAGHSLGWGTASLAADLAAQHEERRAAVIGCGTIGLTTARELQRRGFEVTVYAMAVPPHTTSNMAFASWTPTSGLVGMGSRRSSWDEQFRRAATIAYRQLQLLVGRGYGISWIDLYDFMDAAPRPGSEQRRSSMLPDGLRAGREILGPGEHPFPSVYAGRHATLRIEPSIYLDAMLRDVRQAGGRVVIRQFETARDLMTLGQTVIANCTGLGARDLFGDDQLTALKGQLTFLVPQEEVQYATQGGVPGRNAGGGFLHMMPRRDGIALGGTSERDVWDLEPDAEARREIVEAHKALFDGMRAGAT